MRVIKTVQKNTVTFKTTDKKAIKKAFRWWDASTDSELTDQLLSTAAFLKETQQDRQRKAAMFARLYGSQSLFSFVGSNMSKIDAGANATADRPTMNVIQSVIDTKVAKIGQSRPSPVFLTDNSDYKERRLAKQLNSFVQGEFYNTKAYEKAVVTLRDAEVLGTGVIKIIETEDNKVGLERRLLTEIYTDPTESMYGEPRQLYELKLVDRSVLMAMNPKFKSVIKEAEQAFPDNSVDSSKTVSDMVMVVEGWHLRSGKNSKDGRHTMACTSGIIFDEEFDKDKFPFVFLHESERMLGFWSQGAAERLMGTQVEINQILHTMSKSIRLVGVPSVWIDAGAKIAKTAFNNNVGNVNTFTGSPPIFMAPTPYPDKLDTQLERLVSFAYQQEGVSAMQASSQKPAGLNSGEAIRSYDDISTDRMATISRKYDTFFIELAYAITDKAKDIAERDGTYSTVFPSKRGIKQIDLPEMDLIKDPFVIQCFNTSSLPKDPSGRMQKVTEMITSGMITIQEGRRLLDYPDLEQVEQLANASEERILQALDSIVEDGDYTSPDPFMNLQLANDLCTQYYNLYAANKLEEERAQMLRDFHTQVQTLVMAATPPPPPAMPGQPGAAPGAQGQVSAPQTAAPPVQQGINSAS